MSLRIGTNVPSLAAQRSIAKNNRQIQISARKLATGQRSIDGSDTASFAIGEGLRADVAGLRSAQQNTMNAISLANVAEGGLNEQFNIGVRLRELAVLSASDAVSDTEREFLNTEFTALVDEFDRIARTTQFGRKKLLSDPSGGTMEFLVGATGAAEEIISVNIDADTTASTLNLDGLTVESKDDSREVLGELDNALTELARTRSKFGAVQSRFYHATDNLAVQIENIEEAKSRLLDTDIAEETANLTRSQILQESAIGVLAQANHFPSSASHLISKIL